MRHLTGRPEDQARRATLLLRDAPALELSDLVLAECVYVLSGYYSVARERVADMMRTLIAMPSLHVTDQALLLRALGHYERSGVGFADAYLAARAQDDDGYVVSFERGLDRLAGVRRVEP